MKELIKSKLNEEMTKTEVKNQIKTYIDSGDFNAKIEKIVKDRIKNEKELENKVVEITKNVMIQLYKTLWVKRSMWVNQLSNKST
jgi:hypothetical protein